MNPLLSSAQALLGPAAPPSTKILALTSPPPPSTVPAQTSPLESGHPRRLSFMSSAGGLSSESKFVVRREDRSSELVQSAIGLALSSSLPFRVFPPASIFADLPALFIWDLALELRVSLPVSPSAPSRSAQHWTSSFSRMVRMACL